MKRKAIGFYWTLPVPWAGFRTVSPDVDTAARESRTIAYQRELIRRYARHDGYDLIHETASVELRPDGGTSYIKADLEPVARLCREHGAEVLVADFAEFQGWRSNEPLRTAARELGIQLFGVPIESLPVNGKMFNPYVHFAEWQKLQRELTEGKPARAAAARSRALALRDEGLKNPAIAQRLNDEGLLTLTAKAWTAESLRKFLATTD